MDKQQSKAEKRKERKKKKEEKKRYGAVRLVEQTSISEPDHMWESYVRLSFAYCAVSTDYCISCLSCKEIERLYKTLGKLEKLTWKQFNSLPRESGMTAEKKTSSSYKLLDDMYSGLNPSGSVRFGHIRVSGTDSGVFRVFGAKGSNIFHILLLDKDGVIHHH